MHVLQQFLYFCIVLGSMASSSIPYRIPTQLFPMPQDVSVRCWFRSFPDSLLDGAALAISSLLIKDFTQST
jgi:hypothetical protein